jgi:hypothetical protein
MGFDRNAYLFILMLCRTPKLLNFMGLTLVQQRFYWTANSRKMSVERINVAGKTRSVKYFFGPGELCSPSKNLLRTASFLIA